MPRSQSRRNGRKKSEDVEVKSHSKVKKISNLSNSLVKQSVSLSNSDEDERERLARSSTFDAQGGVSDGEDEEVVDKDDGTEEEGVEEGEKEDEEGGEDEDETKSVENLKRERREVGAKMERNGKRNKRKWNEDSSLYKFPMSRISRIIRSENPDIRISQDALFVINKASEKFLDVLVKEAYAGAFLGQKRYVGYHHLSSVVSKRKRLDFLSDFVPGKVKAEDVSPELSLSEA